MLVSIIIIKLIITLIS